MADLGRFLILLGAVAIVAGLALVLLGTNEHSPGTAARGHYLSGQEQHILFSTGDVDSGQRGAVGGDVFDWKAAEIAVSIQHSAFSLLHSGPTFRHSIVCLQFFGVGNSMT